MLQPSMSTQGVRYLMADFTKTCDRGCNGQITMSQRSGKWLPYNQDGSAHNCQNRRQEPTEAEWRNLQEKNDHGNENQWKTSNVGVNTLSEQERMPKQKRMLVKILRSLNSESLEQMHEEFGKTHAIKYCTYCPVGIGDTIEERLCVYYEAEA